MHNKPKLDVSNWKFRKAQSSVADMQHCVEVAVQDDFVAVRDSKNRSDGALLFTAAEWKAFIGGVKAGEFEC